MTAATVTFTCMRRTARWAVLALVALVAVLAPVAAAGASSASGGKSFNLTSLDTRAELLPNGDMTVVEVITYRFSGGPFTIGVRSFENDRDRITDFRVTENERRLVVDPPNTTPTGEWEWRFDIPALNQSRTFEVRYTVTGAVAVGPDVGELCWQFIGTDHPGIGTMNVRVDVPGEWPVATASSPDDDATVIRGWGHGPSNGRLDVLPDHVTANVQPVPSRQFVEVRVAVPHQAFDVTPSGPPRLERILDQERNDKPCNEPVDRRGLGLTLGIVATAFGAIATAFLSWRYGREPAPTELIGDYWREPLTELPAVTQKNLGRGVLAAGEAIGATLIDLAQRGYLTITAEVQQRIGKDRTIHTFHRTDKPQGPELAPFEWRLLQLVFRGNPSMSSDDLTAWGKANREKAAKELEAFTKAVSTEYKSRGYGTTIRPWAALALAAVAAVTSLVGLLAVSWDQPLGWGAVAAGPILLVVGLGILWNRNRFSSTEAVRAKATQRFLHDFSNLEEAPIGHLILWERHLVDAVTLGVSEELLNGLAAKLPQVVDDPGFAGWYTAGALSSRRFDSMGTFGAVGGAIASSFQPPSSSSSGGGGGFSSGGGGGGGGGGGFGAR